MAVELNVLALYRGQEKYLFVYDDESQECLLDAFRDQAANPELALNWFDARVLTDRMYEQMSEAEPAVLRTSSPLS